MCLLSLFLALHVGFLADHGWLAARTPSDLAHVLYRELWYACAGKRVTIPRLGELVFYFLQGHLEQVLIILYLSSFRFASFLAAGAWEYKPKEKPALLAFFAPEWLNLISIQVYFRGNFVLFK